MDKKGSLWKKCTLQAWTRSKKPSWLWTCDQVCHLSSDTSVLMGRQQREAGRQGGWEPDHRRACLRVGVKSSPFREHQVALERTRFHPESSPLL